MLVKDRLATGYRLVISNLLLLQWGFLGAKQDAHYTITYPISYSTWCTAFRNGGCINDSYAFVASDTSTFEITLTNFKTKVNANHDWASWISIGY